MSDRSEYQRQWRKDHPEKMREYEARRRARERGVDELRIHRNKQHTIRTNAYRKRDRDKAIEFLGGKCVRCGFSDKRALQFDHINGGGMKELKSCSSISSHVRKVLKSIMNGEGKFQLLCANCNWIKRYENGEG